MAKIAKPVCTIEPQKYVPSDDCGSSQRAAADALPVVQRDSCCCSHEAATLKTIGIADCGHHDLAY
jgi:hypothetical protein